MGHFRMNNVFNLIFLIGTCCVTVRDVCETDDMYEYYCEDWSYCCGAVCCDLTKLYIALMVVGGGVGLVILVAIGVGIYGLITECRRSCGELLKRRVQPQNNSDGEDSNQNVPV